MANSAKIGGLNIDLTELSADTSPQLGGNLDLNSNDITGTGNINTTGTITASGTVTGSTFSGSGASLTNLPSAQLTGALPAIDGSSLTGINTDLVSDTTPQLGGNLDAQTNNITNLGTINTHTIPGGTGTLALTSNITHTPSSTDTLTNKTINLSSNTLSGTTAQFNTALSDGSFRVGYQAGEIIETIACMCDGSTVSVQSGNYTITNVSAAQASTSSYVVMTGSEISYTPPTGTTRVLYRYNFKWDCTGYSGISHFKVQVDGTDVVPASRNYSSNYASTNWHHANLELGVEWVFDCNAASNDAANGKFTSWTSAKTIRGLHRHYGGGYSHRLHGNVWWDGTGASGGYNNPIKPFLYIQAIA